MPGERLGLLPTPDPTEKAMRGLFDAVPASGDRAVLEVEDYAPGQALRQLTLDVQAEVEQHYERLLRRVGHGVAAGHAP